VPAEVTAGRGHEIFGTLIEGVRFAMDSPLEGDGFEPSVPVRERVIFVFAKGKRATETTRGDLETMST
jgi:hypothetical protein